MDKLIFVTPPLSTVRGVSFHPKSTWHFEYTCSLRLNDGSIVAPASAADCQIIYSYGFTQSITYLSNVAAIAGQLMEYRIIKNTGRNLQKEGMPLKAIKIYGAS